MTARPSIPPPKTPSTHWPWGGVYIHLAVILTLVALGSWFLDAWSILPLWIVYGLIVLLLCYRDGGHLLGPVFLYDLVRTARQGRQILLRCGYGLLLLSVLFVIYTNRFAGRVDPYDLFGEPTVSAAEMPTFAAEFFSGFLGTQLVVVFLLTPVLTAGAIAEEQERRTLEYLLTTHLTDREIVLGKLASRVGRLALLILTGLPILGILQLLGGVDPEWVLAGFLATAATIVSVASFSILMSVLTPQPLSAIFRTYLYLALLLCIAPCIPGPNFGHPIVALLRLESPSFMASGPDSIWVVTRDYVLVQVAYSILCLVVAVAQLRPAAQRAHDPPMIPDPLPIPSEAVVLGASPVPIRLRPPVGSDALLWKELYVDQEFRWERMHPLFAVLLLFVGVSTAAVGMTIVVVGLSIQINMAGPMNVWMQVVGTSLLCLTCVVAGFYAAGSISRERERLTLDTLLTIPECVDRIFRAKWLGSLLSVRQIGPLLGLVYGLALVTGGLHPLALPLVAFCALSYLVFVTGLGLYCSVVCQGTMRATVYTLLTGLAVIGLTWLAAENSDGLYRAGLPPTIADGLATFLRFGLPPPMQLTAWSFPLFPQENWQRSLTLAEATAAFLGMGCYLAAGVALFRMAVVRMHARTR